METEPFDEAELLAFPASPVASPPRHLKRLKKSSQIAATAAAAHHPVESPLPSPPSPPPQSPSAEETLANPPSPPTNPSPPPQPDAAAQAEASSPAPSSSPPNPTSSPLPPTDTAEEEDDGLDPLFSETCVATAGWDPLGMPPTTMEGEGEEEEMLGGGLIEELRREKSAKKRLDMDEGEEGGGMAMDAEVKGKRSKRRRKEEVPKDESARGKKRSSEKERRAQLDSIHAESQRLLRETRSASFKPSAKPVYKPISSVLEKIRLRKLEILKKSVALLFLSGIPIEEEEEDDDDDSSEAVSGSIGDLGTPQVKEVNADDKDLEIDNAENVAGMNCRDLNQCDLVPENKDALDSDKDLGNCGSKDPDEELLENSQDNLEGKAQSSDNPNNTADEMQLPPSSSPTEGTDNILSEDEEEYNDKENVDPSTQKDDPSTQQRTPAGDSCPDDAILKDFLDVEAEEEDDSDDDMMRFKDNEEDDGSDENEVLNDLIEAGYEEGEIDHENRNALHQKWLQQQDADETNKFMKKLKFGHQEQKKVMDQDEDDAEDCEDESENEMSCDLTPANVVRQNSEKAKQMIMRMFTDDNDTYEHSDDEEIEEHLARQRISKREVHNNSFISPLDDDSSREVFSLIKKLNIAPQPKRRGKQVTSHHELLTVVRDNSASSKSSFLGRTASGSLASSHRSTYRTYVFGRDDSNSSSKSCLSTSESNTDTDQTNSSQPKKAKFSSSQQKQTATKTISGGDSSSSVSLIEVLRRSSSTSDKQEYTRQESCGIITESQAAHQFSAFKLSRRFSRVGARN
uniref:DNA replication checkpoint mediator MRC1 domain-containing protein n=1 Tax=Leersia perrieri TaxID=77586 RepID=A0A0D9W0H7_9ORYZ